MPVGACECVRIHRLQRSTSTQPDEEILLLPYTDVEARRQDGLDGIRHRDLRQVEVASDDVQVLAGGGERVDLHQLGNDAQTLLLERGGIFAQAAILSLAEM